MADKFTQRVSLLELQVQHQEAMETPVNEVFEINHGATRGTRRIPLWTNQSVTSCAQRNFQYMEVTTYHLKNNFAHA